MVVGAGAGSQPAPAPVPSVLLITLDTTRADHLGAYGAGFARTPNLDAISEAGVRFQRALAPTPLTLPTHATMMTGLVPRRHGIRDNSGFRLSDGAVTLAERFRRAGFATAAFVSSAVLDRTGGLSRGFDLYDDNVRIGEARAFGYVERAASQTTQSVIDRLPSLPSPFFLWVHYFDPHLPYVPPEPWQSRFPDRPYDGEIAFMDHEIGRLLEGVRRKAPRLIVVVAGDHGESLGEHGEDGHGIFLYESTQRVPFLLAGPGIPGKTVVDDPVGLIDLAPTVADLAGLAPMDGIDGLSLRPLIRGESSEARDYEMETFYPKFAFGWSALRSLSRGPWKWIEAPRPELYRVSTDPSETENLLGTRPAMARDLAGTLAEKTADDLPAASPTDPALEERREKLESLGYLSGATGNRSSDIDPKDGVAWLEDLEAGRRALQTGEPEKGIAPLERLLGRNPENYQARLALGVCRLRTGDGEGAEADFRRALGMAPDRSLPWLRLADALVLRSREDPTLRSEARRAYENVLSIDPRDADAYRGLLLVLASAKDGTAIDALAARARRADFRDPVFDAEIGVLALARGRTAEAEAAFHRSVEGDPGSARALEGLGRIAYSRGDASSAENWYARALGARPSAEVAKTLGAIRLHELGDRDGALQAFRLALELAAPEDPDRQELQDLVRELSAPL
jgi:arylsulfatase A-like enzyme/Tfp pilus assembly protein PilF